MSSSDHSNRQAEGASSPSIVSERDERKSWLTLLDERDALRAELEARDRNDARQDVEWQRVREEAVSVAAENERLRSLLAETRDFIDHRPYTEGEGLALRLAVVYALRESIATDGFGHGEAATNDSLVSVAEKLGIEVEPEWRS